MLATGSDFSSLFSKFRHCILFYITAARYTAHLFAACVSSTLFCISKAYLRQ